MGQMGSDSPSGSASTWAPLPDRNFNGSDSPFCQVGVLGRLKPIVKDPATT